MINRLRIIIFWLFLFNIGALVNHVEALPFEYAPKDLFFCLRQSGGAYEMVVNIGSVEKYKSIPAGIMVAVSEYNTNQMRRAFSSLDNLGWTVIGAIVINNDTNYPANTIWVTNPRMASENNQQTAPWIRKNAFSQSGPHSSIVSIANGANIISGSTPYDPLINMKTVVIESSGKPSTYGSFVGTPAGNLKTFQGVIENITPDQFELSPQTSRSDLYELMPSSSNLPATYLGYFELWRDGTLHFRSAGEMAFLNFRLEIQGQPGKISINFPTVAGQKYLIRATNISGPLYPASAWPIVGTLNGTGSNANWLDAINESARFYIIEIPN